MQLDHLADTRSSIFAGLDGGRVPQMTEREEAESTTASSRWPFPA